MRMATIFKHFLDETQFNHTCFHECDINNKLNNLLIRFDK